MRSLIALSVKRPVSTLMCFSAVIIFGVIAAGDLSIEFLPEIQVPKLVVTAAYPGLPPEQVKELLTIPLEDSLSSVKGIRGIFSVSREGLCTLEMEFHWGTDMMMAAVETREAIDLVYPSLPADSKKPLVLPINPGEEPLIWVGVFPKSGDIAFARRLADREIKTRLQQVEGVGSIMIIGGTQEELKILVDLQKSIGRGITLDAIAEIISQSNYDFPAGSFKEGPTEFIVKTEGRLKTEEEIGKLVIGKTQQGGRVMLQEVATIVRGTRERTSIFQLNGKEGIALLIRRKGGVSPVRVSDNIKKELYNLTFSYGKDVDFFIAQDNSKTVSSSISNLVFSGVVGGIIAFTVLIIFLRKLSTSLILIISIPISILIALLLLRVSGSSLNIMSLGGLAMGIGMLVDNSVVVLENLERRITSPRERTAANIINYTKEMAGSTFGSTITSLVVFIPVIFLPGIIGALFKDLALSVCYSLFASFLVSITLVPVLSLFVKHFQLPKKEKKNKKRRKRPDLVQILERIYRKGLRLVLRRPLILIIFLAGIFITGSVMSLGLKYEFMPAVDTGQINVTAILPPGTSIDYLARVGKALSEQARWLETVDNTIVRAGGESDDPYFLADPKESPYKLHITVQLKGGNVSAVRAIEDLRTIFQIQNAEVMFSLPNDIIAPLLGIGANEQILIVKGNNQDHALQRAAEIRGKLQDSTCFSTINILPARNKPGISLYPYRDILLRNGMSLLSVSNTLRGYLDGLYPSKFSTEGREIDIRVRLREEDRFNLEQLYAIELMTQQGKRVRLSDCVLLKDEKDFSSLIRAEKKDIAYMELSAREDKNKQADELISNILKDDPRTESLQQSAFMKNLPRILVIFILALLLLYLVLGAQFESFTLPLFLMLSLPLAFAGIVIALVLFSKSINLSSSLGVLVLLGVLVNNSIILFENYKTKIGKGVRAVYAVYRGSSERLKAILITTLTTITALLPIAIDPYQKSSQSPMAVAILGGLTLSTLLTLFVTPLIFLAYFRRKK